jgi:type IV secretory pathway VirD2 relaxase
LRHNTPDTASILAAFVMSDDHFEPKLGKQRQTGGKRPAKYIGRVVVAARLAGAVVGVRNRRFDGSRIGRGASIGRLLSSSDRLAGFRARRAIVKTRLVRLGPKGMATARAHLRYIQRDGVTREGDPGELYSADLDAADGKAFLERCDGDRHQFRFIVSAEDGAEYPDLKPYVRRLVSQVETDLGTKLDWVAVDHFNTERPHTHVMLRGVDDRGQNLIIAREYIAYGFRERASELVTLDLGPRTTREIEDRLRHDVGLERLTAIDRRLLRRMDAERVVSSASRDSFQQSLAAGRLRKLDAMGVADDVGGGRYRLADGMEETLRRMGERGDIIRTMQRELTARKLTRAGVDNVITKTLNQPLVGRVIHRGFSDEYRDRHYLMIDGADGRVHYVDIGKGDATEATPAGAIVKLTGLGADARAVDRTIAEVAAANEGRYSVDLHRQQDPSASRQFAEAHVRRLEAMRRVGSGIKRDHDGVWTVGNDYTAGAETHERRSIANRPVHVEILARQRLEKLAKLDAPTWLDRELASRDPLPLRDAGFGGETRAAMNVRRQWLVEQELAVGTGSTFKLRPDTLAILQRRELLRVAGELSRELGKTFADAKVGARIEGEIVRRIDMSSGYFALMEKSREFTLVPWHSALEKQIGKQASGIMRADGINWRFGRSRAGPEIS